MRQRRQKNHLFLLWICCSFCLQSLAQHENPSRSSFTGNANRISIAAARSLGEFGKTHPWGIEAGYAFSKNSFETLERKAPRMLSIFYEAGIFYFPGTDEAVGNADTYHYPTFFHGRLMAGIMLHPGRRSDVSFSAGPAIGVYRHTTRFNLASKLSGNYFFNQRWGAGPVINFLVEPGSSIMVNTGIGVYHSF